MPLSFPNMCGQYVSPEKYMCGQYVSPEKY